ncbi:MAG: c-type cytochrome [Gemmatimonadota bacterium]|nr:c-type cytochrome [Gemmatimonadota bacterium]
MWRTNLRVLALALGVVGFYTAIAHVIPQLQSEVPEALALTSDATPEALAAAGEKIFNGSGGCTTCHGLGTRAPNLLTDHAGEGTIGARCGSRKPGMDCKAYLYESLVKPGAYVVKGFEPIMPDMSKQLSPDQLWTVVAYLQSQGGEVTVTGADLKGVAGSAAAPAPAAGASFTATTDPVQLYNEKGCVGCHQLDGKGGVVGPSFDHFAKTRTAEYIRRSILLPNADTAKGYEKFAGTMPTNFGQQLSAAQLEALVKYLAGRK